jgi:hypothetical protein
LSHFFLLLVSAATVALRSWLGPISKKADSHTCEFVARHPLYPAIADREDILLLEVALVLGPKQLVY